MMVMIPDTMSIRPMHPCQYFLTIPSCPAAQTVPLPSVLITVTLSSANPMSSSTTFGPSGCKLARNGNPSPAAISRSGAPFPSFGGTKCKSSIGELLRWKENNDGCSTDEGVEEDSEGR